MDILVDDGMAGDDCLKAVSAINLDQYDIIVLSIGANEALSLVTPKKWQQSVATTTRAIRKASPAATRIFLLAIPQYGVNPHFPRRLADVVDHHVGVMNTITEHFAENHPGVIFVPESRDQAYELENAHVYQQWSESIADRICRNLDPVRHQAADVASTDEHDRQLALFRLEALIGDSASDALLDELTAETRRMFGTAIAAVTFIRRDTQEMRSSSGIDPVTIPRSESFCDVTIRRNGHLVIEDASLDSRYAEYSMVSGAAGVRFYAGYPLEAPTGQRIGALCIMDPQPRQFSSGDAAIRRALATKVQQHIYEIGRQSNSAAPAV